MAGKRESGTGSFRKKENGTIEYRVLHDGIAKSFTGKTESECKRKYREWQKELNKNEFAKINKKHDITLIEYINTWKQIKRASYKASSYQRLNCTIRNQIEPHPICNIRLVDLTPTDVNDFLIELAQSYSKSTVVKVYNVLRAVIDKAVRYRIIDIDITADIKIPSVDHFGTRKNANIVDIDKIYTTEELKILHEVVYSKYILDRRKYRYAPIFVLIANTGMRLGEAAALKWENVDFENRRITICDNATYLTRETMEEFGLTTQMIVTDVKTRSSRRTIPMNEYSYQALRELDSRQQKDGIDSLYVLANFDGSIMGFRSVQDVCRSICEENGIQYRGIHALRHTFATMLIRKGTDIGLISRILGHSTVKITYDKYIHFIDEQKIDAINELSIF